MHRNRMTTGMAQRREEKQVLKIYIQMSKGKNIKNVFYNDVNILNITELNN